MDTQTETVPEKAGTAPAAGPSPIVEKLAIPISILLGLALVAGAIAYSGGMPKQAAGEPEPVEVDIKDVKQGTGPMIGDANAPVAIAVWYDYQCGHCQNYEKTTLARVYDEYVAAGKVKIMYKDFQFFGEESDRLSVYGRAVYESNPAAFHAWISSVMAAQADRAFGTEESIDALLARLPGVDAARVKALVAEKGAQYAAAAAADRDEGASFGIAGTPGTIIGTTLVPGALPFDAVKELIDGELK